MIANTESAIWGRMIEPERGDLAPDAARSILGINFRESDQRRMSELTTNANEGTLTPAEQTEAEEYRRAADLLALLHSKARLSLKINGSRIER